jgi:hypothetical protein
MLSLAGTAWSAPKRSQAAPKAAPPETVYVQVTPPRETRSAPDREPAYERKPVYQATGPIRDFGQAGGMYLGFYSAEVLGGTTPYGSFYYDIYPQGQVFFFEFGVGGGTVQSGLAHHVMGEADWFENSFLFTFEALAGYTLAGALRGEGRSGGLFPYLLAGITSVYQGGSPNIGGVLGFGNRNDLPFVDDSHWVVNYGVKDHLYSQRSGNYQTLTQNFVLLLGVQKYF